MENLKGFVQYEKSARRRSAHFPMITIQKAGFLAFNKAAIEKWGEAPDLVRAYFNPDARQIALVPSDITDRTALKVKYYNSGTGQISAQGFLGANNVNHDQIAHYEPHFVDNVMVIPLNQEGKEPEIKPTNSKSK